MELYAEAIALLRRLLHVQRRAGETLPLLRWPALWEALFATGGFLATEEVSALPGVPELGLELLQLINTLAALGPEVLPDAAAFESFAFDVVRGHNTLQGCTPSGASRRRSACSSSLARSFVAHAVDALPQEGAAGKMSPPETAAAVRKLQLQAPPAPTPSLGLSLGRASAWRGPSPQPGPDRSPNPTQVAADSLALVSRPPPPHSPHEQALLRQCVRAMLARAHRRLRGAAHLRGPLQGGAAWCSPRGARLGGLAKAAGLMRHAARAPRRAVQPQAAAPLAVRARGSRRCLSMSTQHRSVVGSGGTGVRRGMSEGIYASG